MVPGAERRDAYRCRISLPFGIHIDRLSSMLRLAGAVKGINSCLVGKWRVIRQTQPIAFSDRHCAVTGDLSRV
jgi:hypothetical protein